MEFLGMVDFLSTNPALAAFFTTFSVGATQFLKDYYKERGKPLRKRNVRLASIVFFAAAVFIHYLSPQGFQVLFDVIAGGVGTTGTAGFIKEMKPSK